MSLIFEDDRLRNKYAKDKKFKEFKDTYTNLIKTKNLNTKSFWNHLNKYNEESLSNSPIYKDKIAKVLQRIKNKSGNLLDIGFGHGEIERSLQQKNDLKLFGTEISEHLVKRARKSFRGTYKVGDIYNIPYSKDFFDFVLVLDVLEHLPADKVFGAYKQIYRVLKKRGALIVSVPMNEGLERMVRKGKNPNGHLREYTPEIIRTELELSGFKILKEYKLYAYKNLYLLKSLITNFFPFKLNKPNLIIIFSERQ